MSAIPLFPSFKSADDGTPDAHRLDKKCLNLLRTAIIPSPVSRRSEFSRRKNRTAACLHAAKLCMRVRARDIASPVHKTAQTVRRDWSVFIKQSAPELIHLLHSVHNMGTGALREVGSRLTRWAVDCWEAGFSRAESRFRDSSIPRPR
jgi:hypothetical protein